MSLSSRCESFTVALSLSRTSVHRALFWNSDVELIDHCCGSLVDQGSLCNFFSHKDNH